MLFQSRLFYIGDRFTDFRFLIDTCTKTTVIPLPAHHHLEQSDLTLQAPNYITHFHLPLARRRSQWIFIQTNVKAPIIDADFLSHFGLTIGLKQHELVDKTTNLSIIGTRTFVHSVGIRPLIP